MNAFWEKLKFTVNADLDTVMRQKDAKDPLAVLNRHLTEAERMTADTGNWLKRQSILHQKLEKELEETSAMLAKRQSQLELAEMAGESDLSAFASAEVGAYASREAELRDMLDENRRELTTLEQRYEAMKHKLKEMKLKQLGLMGKENALRAHRQMDRLLAPHAADAAPGSFDDLLAYIRDLGTEKEEQPDYPALQQRLEGLEKKGAES